MRVFVLYVSVVAILFACTLQFQAHGAPAGPWVKHLSSLLKWTRSATKTPQQDGNVLQFENGYLVETVVEGNEIGVVPYKIRVSEDGELFAVDAINSNVVKITPPLSQLGQDLLLGHFRVTQGMLMENQMTLVSIVPKGLLWMTRGMCVTTIAGGKSNIAGYRDGPSEDAKFSNDFDVVYVRPTCSLLVIDRGNAALRQISLNLEECDYQSSSVSASDVFMVVSAVLVGYAVCILQQGFQPSFLARTAQQHSESEYEDQTSKEKPALVMDSMKESPGWPSFGQLIIDLSKLAVEALGGIFLYFVPSRFKSGGAMKGLTPLKDRLKLPEDEAETPLVHRQSTLPSLSETQQVNAPNATDKYSEAKAKKIKSASFKDPSLSSKHRSSKRQEYAEYFGSGEVPSFTRSKTQKERTRHRQRDKSGEAGVSAVAPERKPVDMNPVNYENPKFNYNIRSKYTPDNSYHF
ncbi:uncharacterized protein LOC119985020 isoform X2 [Tripterygium wilfordii]|uniref:uncharacterized protein LOC119985020 isoform X2 n=1 Tax=Tripterygium wilfordii TaxID=458696 RepID=UPI0018F855F3|nr:uncharacterized protein LOC119985020 isoform X2 [Tripterygium wilfordii]